MMRFGTKFVKMDEILSKYEGLVQKSLVFPKRLTSRGFRNQKEGGAGFWPISPGSVSEGGAAGLYL